VTQDLSDGEIEARFTGGATRRARGRRAYDGGARPRPRPGDGHGEERACPVVSQELPDQVLPVPLGS
jgi:hypothetical protein